MDIRLLVHTAVPFPPENVAKRQDAFLTALLPKAERINVWTVLQNQTESRVSSSGEMPEDKTAIFKLLKSHTPGEGARALRYSFITAFCSGWLAARSPRTLC